jgi:lipoprotein-anchoring transpeptidase ErfK/SrfK
MVLRSAASACLLLLGFVGTAGPALAQLPLPPIFPPFRAPPPPQAVETEDDPAYDPPPGYRQAPPPGAYGQGAPQYGQPQYGQPQYGQPPAQQYGRNAPQDVDSNTLPPPSGYRDQQGAYQGGYEPVDPRARVARPGYGDPQPAYPPAGYDPDPNAQQAGRPNQGFLPNPLDILRPPGSVGSVDPAPGAPTGRQPDNNTYASLPPEERPETGPRKELPPQFRRTMVDYRTREPAGTIVIDTPNTYLYLVLGNGKAMRYGIGVGREGFTWAGAERVSRMAEWPDWHPPVEMIERQPYLPRFMAGGEGNPLGARALYLGKTLYRIHGTNQPSTIGTFVSSGCIRLTNEDVSDLYTRVQVGTRVVVLPGRPPASASAAAPVVQDDQTPPGPYNPLAPPRTR